MQWQRRHKTTGSAYRTASTAKAKQQQHTDGGLHLAAHQPIQYCAQRKTSHQKTHMNTTSFTICPLRQSDSQQGSFLFFFCQASRVNCTRAGSNFTDHAVIAMSNWTVLLFRGNLTLQPFLQPPGVGVTTMVRKIPLSWYSGVCLF